MIWPTPAYPVVLLYSRPLLPLLGCVSADPVHLCWPAAIGCAGVPAQAGTVQVAQRLQGGWNVEGGGRSVPCIKCKPEAFQLCMMLLHGRVKHWLPFVSLNVVAPRCHDNHQPELQVLGYLVRQGSSPGVVPVHSPSCSIPSHPHSLTGASSAGVPSAARQRAVCYPGARPAPSAQAP